MNRHPGRTVTCPYCGSPFGCGTKDRIEPMSNESLPPDLARARRNDRRRIRRLKDTMQSPGRDGGDGERSE